MAKAPKRPKASAPLSSWQSYDKKKADFDKGAKAKAAIIKKYKK